MNAAQFDCSYRRIKWRLRFPQYVGTLRVREFGQSASCGRAKQRMESIKSRVSGVRATVQCHGKSWKKIGCRDDQSSGERRRFSILPSMSQQLLFNGEITLEL